MVVWATLLALSWPTPALASIHTYHEQPGQTTHRSTQSLRDQNDLAWQATIFKRYIGANLQGTYLRLVGFPGRVTVTPEESLSVQTGTATQWVAPFSVAPQTKELPENVAQYDIEVVLQQLRQPIPLTLVVPLHGPTPARLVAAPFVVEEWLKLNQMGASASSN
ncbi:MAG: DUF3122 domain-containing protein [Nodosilinea sp.]